MGLSACSLGLGEGTGTSPNQPPFPTTLGEDGGQAATPFQNGQLAARVETELTDMASFVLRANVPVPAGTYPRADGQQPFTIYDYNGQPLETQTETVTRYADWSDGADVVQVMARVRMNPSLASGAFAAYDVKQEARTAGPKPGSAGVEDLLTPSGLPQAVQDLLADPRGIELAAYDCFGHKYVCYPLDGTGTLTLLSHGRVESKLRVFQTMVPVSPVSGSAGTLPHMFGVHAYLTTQQDDDLLGLDLRFNNGHSGHDTSSPLDDPLDKLYFERLEISVPDTWFVDQDFEDPFFGSITVAGGRRTVGIVDPIPGGQMHVMEWMSQMVRRLMLSTSSSRSDGIKYVEQGAGQGFNVRGFHPTGKELYSWWNRGTSRYFPQNYQLPLLDHIGKTNLRDGERSNWNSFRTWLVNGSNAGNYPVPSSNMGWAHPYGVAYAGMTGGNEIFCYDGVATAFAGSRYGTQAFKGLHRMHTDRMPNALYKRDGTPASVEDWTLSSSKGAYVPFQYSLGPNLNTGDPFGVMAADPFQVNYVEANGLKPSYHDDLINYDQHDFQHFIRYTRGPKVLVWLVNDALAKDDLRMQAENFHLSYHTLNNSAGGGKQDSGMAMEQDFVAQYPGKCFKFGRGEGWGFDCAAAAYSFMDETWRDRKQAWFRDMITMVSRGQGSCNGFIQGLVQAKNLNGQYRTRQQIEQSITENMLQGVRETVFRGDDVAFSDLTRDILRQTLYGFVSDLNFRPGYTKPRTQTAVGPLNLDLPIYCSLGQMPSNGWSTINEAYQDWSSFAWGYEITGDPKFLDRALGQFGSGTLLARLEADGLNNLENRAALIALAQRLNGKL